MAVGSTEVGGSPTREIRRRAALVRRRRGPELVLVVEEEVVDDGAAGGEEGGREEPTRTRRGRGGEGAPASSGVPGGEVEVQRRGGVRGRATIRSGSWREGESEWGGGGVAVRLGLGEVGGEGKGVGARPVGPGGPA